MKVSVIIPSYNHEKYIKSAVESVLSQSFNQLEIIAIDDGSTDKTFQYLKRFKDPRLSVFQHENRGAHATINQGLNMATGDYITILNSDDQYHKDRIKIMMDTIIKRHADFVSSWIEIIDEDGNSTGLKRGWNDLLPWEKEVADYELKENGYFNNLVFSNFISTTSNMLFHKSLIDEGFRMRPFRYVHDWDFALNVAAKKVGIQIEESLIKYRVHGKNTIRTNKKEMLFEIALLQAANIGIISDRILSFESEDLQTGSIEKINGLMAFQGNERLVVLLKTFIDSLKRNGICNAVEYILGEEKVKRTFLALMND